jgi:Predicted membrane protein
LYFSPASPGSFPRTKIRLKLDTEKNIDRGVRTVAIFEALKGIVVLAAGFGLLALLHRDLQAIAERLVELSHLNPAHHYPTIFIEAMSRMTDSRIMAFAAMALLYSTVRFIEAYGLWHLKAWAEWFAIVSGSIYIPIEVYEVFVHVTWLRITY